MPIKVVFVAIFDEKIKFYDGKRIIAGIRKLLTIVL
jgi:hypothetical protein